MYIKQVIIQGFKSYRDQTVVEPFSPRHNVIVGRNGSGKSNFFLAIQFVLSDEFSNMRQEERQQLLHEGAGPQVMSAYVEVVFDNSDGRLPIEKDEVCLRRVIGAKKDQYFLDKKNITKQDVVNLLESAGFSRCNPYYIVKQGKINQLAVAKDHERLKLLREVAGARVYDERKEESEVILRESEGKRSKIDELLKYIEERLDTLEKEKEELKEFQRLDKEKRCLEYTIYGKELKEANEKLDELDGSRLTELERSNDLQKQLQTLEHQISDTTHKVKACFDQNQLIVTEKKQLEDEQNEMVQQRTRLELSVRDLEESVRDGAKLQKNNQKEHAELQHLIADKERELDALRPSYQMVFDEEKSVETRMRISEQKKAELYARQGRHNSFQSKEERDSWIKKEIKNYNNALIGRQAQVASMREELMSVQRKLQNLAEEIQERELDMNERKHQIEATNRELSEMKTKRSELSNARKDLWREEANLQQCVRQEKEELLKAERNMRSTISKAVGNGLDSVNRVVEEKGITGVHGPLINNVQCDEKFFTAVEVTAGNKLFNIIVEDDKTASLILASMNKMQLPGEVTFMPLNRLKFKDIQYPKSQDVIPLLSRVSFDDALKPAMQLAFGKTLLCRNMEVACQFSKSEELDCVTLDGDQKSYRGPMTGGFYDTRHSRLELQKVIRTQKGKLGELEENLSAMKEKLANYDNQINNLCSDCQRLEIKLVQLKDTYEKQKQDTRSMTYEKSEIEKSIKPKEKILEDLNSEVESVRSRIQSLNEELGTDLMSQLSTKDQREINQLTEEMGRLQEQLRSIVPRRAKLESDKQALENMLHGNLYRRRDETKQAMEETNLEEQRLLLQSKTEELKISSGQLDKASSRITSLETQLESSKGVLKQLQSILEELKNSEKEKRELLLEDSKSMEKIASKRSVLLKKKEESVKKIRELGSLPQEAFDKYQNIPVKSLWKKLNSCNEDLKKFSHVNKKALDQYMSFSEQKEKLMKRKNELDKGHEAILDLMDVLEKRKHEAIMFTFKQVSHYFSEVFQELVPGGKATLVMKKDVVEDTPDDAGLSQPSQRRPSDEFTGISIKISFTGKTSETYEMNQLSGGQKTLVALTLIFAIQKCDTAPFYLFDEIDQALDPQYRKAVADMIHKLADKAQFITTTFRPELLEHADKFYGVRFWNRVSQTFCITRDQAQEFVEDDTMDT